MKHRLATLAVFSITFGICVNSATASGFSSGTFNESSSMKGLESVSDCPGVYIIYRDGDPFYVGRSRVGVYKRLKKHINGEGSRKVAELLGKGYKLSYEYLCTDSMEQAEAQLISELGTDKEGNLRKETDPADWE